MGSIQSVLLSVRQGDWMASIDLRGAYLQVPVHPASRHFLRFMFRDTVYQFKALCFGLSTAPQVFTWVMAPVSAILHSLGIRMRRYLDDWLVQSSSQESFPRGSSDCPPTLSRIGDCHPSQEVQPHTFPGSAVSVGRHRFHLFQGFSVGGTHLTAAIHNRRISVMRLAYREPVAVASRRSFLAGSPRSWRLTEDAVPPALPPSFLVPSGSGGSSVSVDDVSSRSPVLAPSTSSVSRGVLSARCLLTYTFWSDASEVGWGAHLDCQVASGLWDPQRQGTARCSAGAFPVPVSSPRSHSGCLLCQHHSVDLPLQGGWHQVSSPQHLGSGDLALDGVPLHPPGSTVPSGLRQRPSRRPVLTLTSSHIQSGLYT